MLSWHTLKNIVDARSKVDAEKAELLLQGDKLTGTAYLADGSARTFSVKFSGMEMVAVRALVGRVRKKVAPEQIDGIALGIDWRKGAAHVSMYYRDEDGRKVYNEQHTFE